jgi:hypothetical protein
VRRIANRSGSSNQPDVVAEEFIEDGNNVEKESKIKRQKIRLAWNVSYTISYQVYREGLSFFNVIDNGPI